jgi:hypothetical protein
MSLMRRPSRVAPALAALLLAVSLIAGGCGVPSTNSSSSSVVPSTALIIARTSTASSPVGIEGHHLTASASCRPGEQMLGGGYSLQGVFESDYMVLATYPAAPGTWTVRTASGSTYQLQTIVYCLASYPSLGLQIQRAESCPAGMVQTATGFSSTSADSAPGTVTHYVVCGSQHLSATAKGFRVGSSELDCVNQSTGNNLSETRSFAYTCSVAQSPPPISPTV